MRRFFMIFAGLCACVFATGFSLHQKSAPKFRLADLEGAIKRDLKQGDDKQKVLNFLKRQDIKHFGYRKDDSRGEEASMRAMGLPVRVPDDYDNERLRSKWKLKRYSLSARVRSVRKDPEGWPVYIWVHFLFDEHGKMLDYRLNEKVDSP
jgi:hypothetical protein